MMRTLAALAVAGLLATGCIDVDQKLALNADGSGTFEVKYSVPEQTVNRMRGMMKLSEHLSIASAGSLPEVPEDEYVKLVFDPDEDSLRAKLDSYERYGIKREELKVTSEGATRKVKFRVRFADIATVSKADFFRDYGFSLVRAQSGNYVLYTQPVNSAGIDPNWDFTRPEVANMLAPLLAGFRFNLNVKVPGRILKTNAHRQSGNAGEWTFDFNSDPNALVRLQREQINMVFDSKGVTIRTFRQKGEPATAPAAKPKS